MTTADRPAFFSRGRLLFGAIGAFVIARLWVSPLGASLSLDEFGTWWVTNAGFVDVLSRARLFPQSVAYAAIVWLVRSIGGASEIALRLPSLIAMGLAAWALVRLGGRLVDREAGWLAGGIFAAYPSICYAAGDARPYAFAVLATVGAIAMLVRWLDGGRLLDALGYVVLASAAIWFQYLFATMLVVHAAYALRRWRRGGVGLGALALAACGVAALTAPAALLAREVGRDRALHAFGVMPGVRDLALALVPTGVVAALLGSWLVCRLSGLAGVADRGDEPRASGDALWLLSLWAVVPAAILFAASHLGGAPVFVPRYLLCMVPAQALLLGWSLRRFLSRGGARAAVVGYLLIQVLARGLNVAHTNEDWRGAAAAVRAAAAGRPVFLSGTYTESRHLPWVGDPRHAAYMRAPLDYYPGGGRIEVLPLFADAEAPGYVEHVLGAAPDLENGFVLVERSSRFPSWAPWLEKRLSPMGYRARKIWSDGNPSAWLFERSSLPVGAP